MKRMFQPTCLTMALLASNLTASNELAKPPVIKNMSGVGGGNATALGGYGTDIQLFGDFAYVTCGGLVVFDIANPVQPARLGSYESRANPNAVWVADHRAFLAGGEVRTLTNDPGTLEIVDVSIPSNPKFVGGVGTSGRAIGIRVAGHYAYVAESTRWTGTQQLGALEIFDISQPEAPVRVAAFDTAGSVTSVEVSGGYAYIADGVTDLQVLDVSDPTRPQRVGVYVSDVTRNGCGFEPGGPATIVQLQGRLAFSAGDNGLHVLDVSDPRHPFSIGDNFCFPLYTFQADGQRAYGTVWSSWANSFILFVADASDPARLVGVGTVANWYAPIFRARGQWLFAVRDHLLVFKILNRPVTRAASVSTNPAN